MVWRHFYDPDTVLVSKTLDYGKKWSKIVELTGDTPMAPFDQPTVPTTAGSSNLIGDTLVAGGMVTHYSWPSDSSKVAYRADQDDNDTFELFIGHRSNFARTYWHIAFNAAGAIYDNVALEKDYNLKFRHAVGVTPDGWTLEIAIPFKSLGLSGPPLGKTWRGNFCRARCTTPREMSTWANVEKKFHDTKTFGEWTFAAE